MKQKGDMKNEYQKLFQQQSYNKFKPFIDEFNDIITDTNLVQAIENYFEELHGTSEDTKMVKKFEKAVREEFSPIELY
jgi:hypothetical protein